MNGRITGELLPTSTGETAIVDLRDEEMARSHRIQTEEKMEEQPALTTGPHNELKSRDLILKCKLWLWQMKHQKLTSADV